MPATPSTLIVSVVPLEGSNELTASERRRNHYSSDCIIRTSRDQEIRRWIELECCRWEGMSC